MVSKIQSSAVPFFDGPLHENAAAATSGRGGGGGEPKSRRQWHSITLPAGASSQTAMRAGIVTSSDAPGAIARCDDGSPVPVSSKLAINDDGAPSPDAAMQDHTASNDDADGSMRIIGTLDNRKIRFDGQYLYLPNTKPGQQLAQMITGEKHRRRGNWIVLHARAVSSEITALLSIFTAMSEAITPPERPHFKENQARLIKAGVRGAVVNDLARDPWLTPDIIDAWVSELRGNNPPDKLGAVLLRILQSKLPPPHLLPGAGTYRRGQAVILAGERFTVDGFLDKGETMVLMSASGEMEFCSARADLQLASS
jgi:hypothetical protein